MGLELGQGHVVVGRVAAASAAGRRRRRRLGVGHGRVAVAVARLPRALRLHLRERHVVVAVGARHLLLLARGGGARCWEFGLVWGLAGPNECACACAVIAVVTDVAGSSSHQLAASSLPRFMAFARAGDSQIGLSLNMEKKLCSFTQ